VHTNGNMFLSNRSSNFITYGFINAKDTMYKLHHDTLHYCSNSTRGIILNHIVMFHVLVELEQLFSWVQFNHFSYQFVTLDSGFHMGLNGGDHFTTS
jgi:hypothetical protein